MSAPCSRGEIISNFVRSNIISLGGGLKLEALKDEDF